jgi:hypothetical protein
VADRTRSDKGFSLAKGPVGIVGAIALAYGILGLIFGSTSFSAKPPSGTVNGGTFLGIEGNGWTYLLIVAGGVALLLSAPLHWGAKTMALIVGLVFGAASVIAIFDGHDVFGIFAANGLTELVLGIAAVVLLVLALLPRVGRNRGAADDDRRTGSRRTTRDDDDLPRGVREREQL